MRVETDLLGHDADVSARDAPSEIHRGALTRTWVRPRFAIAATVAAAFLAYAFLGSTVQGPRGFADELLYFDTAAALADGDGLTIRGERYRYAPLYPVLLASVHWLAPDREAAYELAKALNALVFALTAIPVFLVARRVLPPWSSVAAGALAVAIPSATYVSAVMTESLAYLAFWWTLYAIALMLERPSVGRQLGALAAALVATGVRTQFVVLFGVYLLALVVTVSLSPERRARLRTAPGSMWPTGLMLVLGLLVLVASSFRAGSAPGGLGEYSALWRSYHPGDVAWWVVYHLANLELYLAVVPMAVAPIGLALLLARARRGSERDTAFLALFVAANAVLLVTTAAFNTTPFAQGLFHDRPLFYVVPLWLVVFLVWLAEGAPRPALVAGVGAVLALALPLLLPFSDYAQDDLAQEFEAVPTVLWATIDSLGPGRVVLAGFTVLLVLAALLVPVRVRYLLPAIVVFVFAVTAELSWLSAGSWAEIRAQAVSSVQRSWLDEQVPPERSAALLTTLRPCDRARLAWDGFYLSEFFNSSVHRARHLGRAPDALPGRAGLDRGRVLLPSGEPLVADYVVTQPGVRVEGRRVAEGTNARLVLWEVSGPVRVLGARSAAELERLACAAPP